MTCKECDKKIKIKGHKDLKTINCEKSNCQLKYNMQCQVLDFTDTKMFDEPIIISQFESPAPKIVNNEISEADWLKMLNNGEYYAC